MFRPSLTSCFIGLVGLLAFGCAATANEEPASESEAQINADGDAAGPDTSTSGEDASAHHSLSSTACEQMGGAVIGDPGDGRVHRDDFLCPGIARPPVASVPFGFEGAVCCLDPDTLLEEDECLALGGGLVPDPGDGRTLDPAFRCPGSGERPLASVRFGIEGGACCR